MQPSVSTAQFVHKIHCDLLIAASGIIIGNVQLLSTPTPTFLYQVFYDDNIKSHKSWMNMNKAITGKA